MGIETVLLCTQSELVNSTRPKLIPDVPASMVIPPMVWII